jgi:transposase InsO family protein
MSGPLTFNSITQKVARVFNETQYHREFTEGAHAMALARLISSDRTVRVLKPLVRLHGALTSSLMDNGTEVTSNSLRSWRRFTGIETIFIEPGPTWQNAYIEMLSRKNTR